MAIITLSDGREIRLDTYYQSPTYGGLLAGLPNERRNQEMVDEAVKFAGENHLLSCGAPVALIPPKIEHRATGISGKQAKIWSERTGSNVTLPLYYPTLPSIECVAHFMSGGRKGKPDEIWSQLCLVWFQPDFGLPIDPDVEREIQKVAWDELAAECEP